MRRVQRAAVYLLAGLMAVDTAGTTTLLVHGVTAKRIVAVVTGVVVAAVAGAVIAIRTPTPGWAARRTVPTDVRPEREAQ